MPVLHQRNQSCRIPSGAIKGIELERPVSVTGVLKYLKIPAWNEVPRKGPGRRVAGIDRHGGVVLSPVITQPVPTDDYVLGPVSVDVRDIQALGVDRREGHIHKTWPRRIRERI